MSRIFYDHLIILTEVEAEIKDIAETHEERDELWQIVDEIIHHKALGCILDNLGEEHHEEFLCRFHETPYDENLLDYLRGKIEEDIEELIRQEISNLASEMLMEIRCMENRD